METTPYLRWRTTATVAGTVITLLVLAHQPIWANVSMCGVPQRGALTDAFPTHFDRLSHFARLLWQGQLEHLGLSIRAYSRTMMPNGIIIALTATLWWAAGVAATKSWSRLTGRCS